jgi:hypothetical protein
MIRRLVLAAAALLAAAPLYAVTYLKAQAAREAAEKSK